MFTIVESIKKIVEDEIRKLHLCEVGEITSVFPHSKDSDKDNYECNVRLKDKGVELRKVPVATSHIGLAHIPHVGDLVLLSFVNGDINAPIITGRLYNDEDRPPTTKMEEVVYQPPYKKDTKLRRAHISLPDGTVTISAFDDRISAIAGKSSFSQNSAGEIGIRSTKDANAQSGSFIDIDNGKILCSSKGGGECTINLSESGDIKITTSKNLTIECEKDITITCGGKFSLQAKGDVDINAGSQGGTVNVGGKNTVINPDDLCTLAGNSTHVVGRTNTEVHSGPQGMEVTSDGNLAMNSNLPMDISSKAIVSLKGTLVNIN